MSVVLDQINPQSADLVPLSVEPLVSLGEMLSATALDLPETISYEEYESLGTALGMFDRACRWWIGDWLIRGEDLFPDRYAQAAALTGLSEMTLMQRVSTARAIPPRRRRHLVSYSVHVELRKLPPREQTKWLTYAEKHTSTVSEIRVALKPAANGGSLPTSAVETDTDLLIDAVRDLVRNAEVAGENVIVRADDFARVQAALGEE